MLKSINNQLIKQSIAQDTKTVLQVNDILHAELQNGCIIHGQIDKINSNNFLIDDDISGDMMYINFDEIVKVYFLG